MEKFAFILHPLEVSDVKRKFKFTEKLPDGLTERMLQFLPPFKISNITGVRSIEGKEVEGCFSLCPLTSKQLLNLPVNFVLKKIIQAGKVAEKQGARIVGLGAFTSVVGDAGITIADNLNIAVTTGNSYTVATALEGTKNAAQLMGIELKKARVVIIGATGSIGRTCAHILAPDVKYLTLAARDEKKLTKIANELLNENGTAVNISTNPQSAIKKADIIITVTGSADTIIEPQDLKPGAVVCDVARPRDVSRQVAEVRDDVLVIEGGVVEVPGDVEFNLNFGFPPKTSYACMAETMILSLEGRYENFTLGREISVAQVEEISSLAAKHGFRLAGLRSFERAISPQEIETIRNNALRKLDKESGVVYNYR